MMVNCVMLGLENPFWKSQCMNLISNHFNYIDTDRCIRNEMTNFYEVDPHITLACGLINKIGPNSMYCFLKILCREIYAKLKEVVGINLEDLVIDTFKSDEGYVLKINLDDWIGKSVLEEYRNTLIEKYGLDSNFPDYHPHITITYLRPELTEDQVNQVIDSFDKKKLSKYLINKFMISDDSSEVRETRAFPINL